MTIAYYENEFNSCLDKLEVWDHAAVGCFYTWSNRQSEEEFVVKKLDRVLINQEWGSCLCVFCRNCLESRDHIFFECSFTRRIWDDMMQLCLVSNAQFVWEDLIALGVKELKGKGLRVIASKLA